jgi:hypothetical protein
VKRPILLGLGVLAGLLVSGASAQAQHMKMVVYGGGYGGYGAYGHQCHLFHHGAYGVAPLGFAGVQPMYGQSGVAAQGVNFLDVLRILDQLQNHFPPNNPSSNVTSKLNEIDAKIAALTVRVVALEDKKEENRQARVLVETHDEILKKHDAALRKAGLIP